MLSRIILYLFCALFLFLIYIGNEITRIKDPIAMFAQIKRSDPNAVGFSAGYNELTKKYDNFTFNTDTEFTKTSDTFPIDTLGNVITTISDDHGKIYDLSQDKGGGFRIEGFSQSFKCPDGYKGFDCSPEPLCDDIIDDNKRKPMTYNQFSHLQLFNDTKITESSLQQRRKRRQQPAYHPRIFIQCKTNGDYEFGVCKPNQLLDFTSMQCNNYDICTDHLEGYRHKYPISSSDTLNERQYYLCSKNRSVLMECDANLVFSDVKKICVTKNLCFNEAKGKTFKIDDNSFLQCDGNDNGNKVNCSTGLILNSNTNNYECKPKKQQCQPYTVKSTTDLLSWTSKSVICDSDNNEVLIDCGEETREKTWTYPAWGGGNPVSFSIEWPVSILKDNACVELSNDPNDHTFDDELYINPDNSIVELAWSEAMEKSPGQWNIKKQQYVCPDGVYRWDYLNNKLYLGNQAFGPETVEYVTYDTSTPCAVNKMPSQTYGYRYILPPKYAAIPINLDDTLSDYKFWPIIVDGRVELSDLQFIKIKLLGVDEIQLKITKRQQLSGVPYGFISKPYDEILATVDDIKFDVDDIKTSCEWYGIFSGQFKPFALDSPITTIKTTTINCIREIKSSDDNDVKFMICWRALKNTHLHSMNASYYAQSTSDFEQVTITFQTNGLKVTRQNGSSFILVPNNYTLFSISKTRVLKAAKYPFSLVLASNTMIVEYDMTKIEATE